MANDANTMKVVDLLVQVANLDTVYRDLHLRRARQLLSPTLDEFAYRALGSAEKDIDDLTRRSRTAVLQRDWAQAAELSGQIEALRRQQTKMRGLAATGKEIYEADAVVFEPFSPGKHLSSQARANQAELHTQVMSALTALAKLDSDAGAFYEKRRSYFAALEVQSAAAGKKDAKLDRGKTEQLAFEAAERGDTAALERIATELRDWKESGARDRRQRAGHAQSLRLSHRSCRAISTPDDRAGSRSRIGRSAHGPLGRIGQGPGSDLHPCRPAGPVQSGYGT